MTEPTETIMAWPTFVHWQTGQWSANTHYDDRATSYTRTDLIPALEAAAYARGLEDAAHAAHARLFDLTMDSIAYAGEKRMLNLAPADVCFAATSAIRALRDK